MVCKDGQSAIKNSAKKWCGTTELSARDREIVIAVASNKREILTGWFPFTFGPKSSTLDGDDDDGDGVVTKPIHVSADYRLAEYHHVVHTEGLDCLRLSKQIRRLNY